MAESCISWPWRRGQRHCWLPKAQNGSPGILVCQRVSRTLEYSICHIVLYLNYNLVSRSSPSFLSLAVWEAGQGPGNEATKTTTFFLPFSWWCGLRMRLPRPSRKTDGLCEVRGLGASLRPCLFLSYRRSRSPLHLHQLMQSHFHQYSSVMDDRDTTRGKSIHHPHARLSLFVWESGSARLPHS